MKILYENTSYEIELSIVNEDINSTYIVSSSRSDLVTITQNQNNNKRFTLEIGDINREDVLIELTYIVIDSLGHSNTSKEYGVLKSNVDDDVRYYNKIIADSNFVNVDDYEDEDILAKILNTDTIGSNLNANYLDSYEPSPTAIENGIPIIDSENKIPAEWTTYPPSILSFSWDDPIHHVNMSYTLTIDAQEYNNQNLTYLLTVSNSNPNFEVTIIQDETPNIFHISYGNYNYTPYIEFNLSIINENGLVSKMIEPKLLKLNEESPIINDITWDINDHTDNNSYTMTIDAADPNNQNLTYQVECNDVEIIINQHQNYSHVFQITYPDYHENKTIIYIITVMNEDNRIVQRIHSKLVINVIKVGDTGIFGGGYDDVLPLNVINYIVISHLGNVRDFGDLTVARHSLGACSNGALDRGVFGGGTDGSKLNILDYITISSPGNAIDFGDLITRRYRISATSNGIHDRGVFDGGDTNRIDYITISIAGNALDFGDLTNIKNRASATSNGINERGIFGGGVNGSNYLNKIDYITISTTGNAADFGDLTVSRHRLAACSNGINERGIFAGGKNNSNDKDTIDYITISTLGNAIDFGDLSIAKSRLSATSNGTDERGIFAGGYDGSSYINTIEYITISTLGNADNFGNLPIDKGFMAACSDA